MLFRSVVTNHHVAYTALQRASSVSSDYLTNGFLAHNRPEEISAPGYQAKMMTDMKDVTEMILSSVKGITDPVERDKKINEKISEMTGEVEKKGADTEADIVSLFEGKQYMMHTYKVFKDIRIVYSPPLSIGNYGGEIDNWMWPRHTGDFSLFRIYVNKNNEPADYSPDNVPYRPKRHLPISLKGAEKGDFTFVFGYPGTTQEYLPSFAVEMITGHENPPAIRLRGKRLDIFDHFMNQSDLVRIQYSAKHAGVAN